MAAYEFLMPSLGADMDYGKIVSWMISPGDKVKKGQVVAEVETPKTNIEIESFYDGVVKEILIPEGQRTDVGVAIAIFDVQGKIKKTETVKSKQVPLPTPTKPHEIEKKEKIAITGIKISPRAKKLIAEHNITSQQISTLQKSIIEGVDILNLLESPVPQETLGKVEQRQLIIARLMEKSKKTIPHFHIEKEIILEKAMNWMHKQNETRAMEDRYIIPVLFIKALAIALRKFPKFNGNYIDDHFIASEEVNIGIITSLREGGLVAPAVNNVDTKPLDQLMHEFRDLVERAKSEKLKRTEMQSATVCLTNLGDRGADKVFGIIYPPQVAIFGTGAILKRAHEVDGQIKEQVVCNWTLSADHRVTDGHQASLLLNKIDTLLQKPEKLVD